jgi:hypothetical protein
MSRARNAGGVVLDYLTVAAVYVHGAASYARALTKRKKQRRSPP